MKQNGDFYQISIGILTVSDTCSRNKSLDRSGPTAIHLFKEANFYISFYECVPDEVDLINSTVLNWIESKKVNFIITLGGTGISPRDVTSDVLMNIITNNNRLPGLEHLLYSSSLKHTSMAALSRFVAGVRDEVILVTLPGSANAVKECIPVILPVIRHAVALVKDWKDITKQEHQSHYNVHSNCEHYSKLNDINFDIVNRLRQSEYPIISVEKALEKVFEVADSTLVAQCVEAVHYTKALGRVIGVDLKAQQSIPPFDASIMDGYAVNASAGVVDTYKVLGALCAGDDEPDCNSLQLTKGVCVRVNTGGPIPFGADCVVPVEQTKLVSTKIAGNGVEEDIIELVKTSIKPGQFIRYKGCDLNEEFIFKHGSIVTYTELGLLSAAGVLAPWNNVDEFILNKYCDQLSTHDLSMLKKGGYLPCLKQHTIGILSTGNELTDAIYSASNKCIRDSNRPLLLNLLNSYGFSNIIDFGIISDNSTALHEVFQQAFKLCDILITTGGVSMGERDLVTAVLKDGFNATVHFGRIFMKPGKPTTFLSVPRSASDDRKHAVLLFCLPGNPVSAYVTSHLFVLPLLRKLNMQSADKCTFPKINVRLLHSVKLGDRPEYRRGRLVWLSEKASEESHLSESVPCVECDNFGDQRSSRLASCLESNLLVILPPISDDLQQLPLGSIVPALIIGTLN